MFSFYVVVFVTALAAVPFSSQLSAPTYPWTDAQTGEPVTCEMCPPGTYVGSHCSENRRTQCLSCAESQYTEYWNYVEECLMCDYPCTEVQEEVHGCNGTHNRVCQCKEGYYSTFSICLRHTVCPPGEGVSVNGTREQNVECAPCKHNYFSNETSSTASCQPHSVCGAHQRAIHGSATYDTFCSSCRANSNSIEPEVQMCNKEAVQLVLERLILDRQKQRLLRALRHVNPTGPTNLKLPELLDLLVANKSTSGMNTLLEALAHARLTRLRSTIEKWFNVQRK